MAVSLLEGVRGPIVGEAGGFPVVERRSGHVPGTSLGSDLLDAESVASDQRWAGSLARHLGPRIMEVLSDPDVTEIYANPNGRLWLKTNSRGRIALDLSLSEKKIRAFLNAVASELGEVLTREECILQAELPRALFARARLQAEVPPFVEGPSFNIRKRPRKIYRLEDYVERGGLHPAFFEALVFSIQQRHNIAVCGQTDSGKTTFANAVIEMMVRLDPSQRIFMAEDTQELISTAEDTYAARTPKGWSLGRVVKVALRKSPDRVLVGEIRDADTAYHTISVLQAGFSGALFTVHSGSVEECLDRMDWLARDATPSGASQAKRVAETINTVVVMRGGPEGRRVVDLARIAGLDEQGQYKITRLEFMDETPEPTDGVER